MRRLVAVICVCGVLLLPGWAQGKRIWVLRAGEMVEYDPATFAVKETVKIPAGTAAGNVAVNRAGQILIVPTVSLPLSDEDVSAPPQAWLWNGKTSTLIDLGVKRETGSVGSNQAVTETAPALFLSADGAHLYWFGNSQRRLQREEVDLSAATTWLAWRTDLSGGVREELASVKLPDCRCMTGACEESCPVGTVWVPEDGVENFFVMTQFVAAKTGGVYKASTVYRENGGKWAGTALAEPLHRVLDAASGGDVMVDAIPDTGCCGWVNESDDQTVVRNRDKSVVVFDERQTFKNPDYDVSFFTANAKLSPGLGNVAMTVAATATPNQTIQLAEDGQANPEESKAIRKALGDLPAVEVTSAEGGKRVAYVPHASVVGWISEKELLMVEERELVVLDVGTGAKRKSGVKVEDAGKVWVR